MTWSRGVKVGAVATWLAVGLLVAACGGGDPAGPGTEQPALTVSPASSALRYPGDTVRLVAGGPGASGALQWTSSDAGVVQVSSDGLATAVGYGTAAIRVQSGGLEAAASLRVTGDTTLAFLTGAWTTTIESGPQGLGGTGLLVVTTDQSALRGVWQGELNGEPVEVATLSVRRGSGWTMARADGVRGRYAVMDGSIQPGLVTLSSGTKLGGGLRERTVLSDFTSTGFRWTVEESEDAGATWTAVWTQSLHRTDNRLPPPSLETMSPVCSAPEYIQFDFWRGDWTVTVPSGGTAGSNLIHRVAGCGIQENWRDASSGGGVSLNMYDPRSRQWGQFYVASTGGSIELYGTLGFEGMVLQTPSGSDRVVWSVLEDGRVRQHWTQGGSTVFDGYYKLR